MHKHSLYEAMKNQWGKHGGLTGYEIGPKCWHWIYCNMLAHTKAFTLEFGSGLSTWLFAMHSSEHIAVECSPHWFSKTVSSPFVQHADVYLRELDEYEERGPWYNMPPLRGSGIPPKIIFVDGPEGNPNGPGRMGFLNWVMNMDNCWINKQKPIIIIDDTNRTEERKLLEDVSEFLERPFIVHREEAIGNKSFGTIGGETPVVPLTIVSQATKLVA